MKIRFIIIIAYVFISWSCQSQEESAYIFSYFTGKGRDGLHLAYSHDGYNWQSLGDSSWLKPQVGRDKLFRDPCIIQGPEGKFHMVWTVSWNESGIGYASSEDLIHWSEQKYLPVMESVPETKNCWAPELFYNEINKEFIIYWSSTVGGKFPETENTAEENWNHRIYFTTTQDFDHLSKPKLLYDPGFNAIDAVITKLDDQYMMVIKNETKFPEVRKDLHTSFSHLPDSGFGKPSDAITGSWVEGLL